MTEAELDQLAELWRPVRDMHAEIFRQGQPTNRDRLAMFLHKHLDDVILELRALGELANNADMQVLVSELLPRALEGLTIDEDRELARDFEVAVSTVRRWQRGTARPHYRVGVKIILAAERIKRERGAK